MCLQNLTTVNTKPSQLQGKQQPGAWKRTAFSITPYTQLWLQAASGSPMCLRGGRDAHLGSYSHEQPPAGIQGALLKHIPEPLPHHTDIPAKSSARVTRLPTATSAVNHGWKQCLQQRGTVGSFTNSLRLCAMQPEKLYRPKNPV